MSLPDGFSATAFSRRKRDHFFGLFSVLQDILRIKIDREVPFHYDVNHALYHELQVVLTG